jgi:hypothetical protein
MGDFPAPWFAGMRLTGELASQYHIEGISPHQSDCVGEAAQSVLSFENLAPINIFVGANNSGKSRLMRELFWHPESIRGFQLCSCIGGGLVDMKMLHDLLVQAPESISTTHLDVSGSYGRALNSDPQSHHWFSLEQAELLHEIKVESEARLLDASAKQSNPRHAFDIEMTREIAALTNFQGSFNQLNDAAKSAWLRIQQFKSVPRCYVPMLRGMRPEAPSIGKDKSDATKLDPYKERTIYDYFRESHPIVNANDEPESIQPLRLSSPDEEAEHDGGWGKKCIFTGLGLYSSLQKRLLAPTQKERQSIRNYEEFLSDNFFPGLEVTLTPALENSNGERNDVVHIKIGDDEDRPIHKLGDGMQGLIICTYPIITETSEGSLFFLEEPDIGMHPSLQRVFLDVLKKFARTKGHQFFLTTHSNHMLDLLEDDESVSIFSFSQVDASGTPAYADTRQTQPDARSLVPKFQIRPALSRDRSVLAGLGVRPSATYLANATIWVEGVTDCNYIKAYMDAFRLYLAQREGPQFSGLAERLSCYKEDRHYSFVEYNGANIVHFDFSDLFSPPVDGPGSSASPAEPSIRPPELCGNAIVVFDGDNQEKRFRVNLFKEQLRERLLVLPGKEIENLIPELALKKQLGIDRANNRLKIHWPAEIDSLLEGIGYCHYARKKQNANDPQSGFRGIGGYLHDLGISGYAHTDADPNASGVGALKNGHKMRWAKATNGIPSIIRQLARDCNEAPACREAVQQLPGYITHDIILLCVLIYEHVARSSHDDVALCALSRLRMKFLDFHGFHPTSDGTGASVATVEAGLAEAQCPHWLIDDQASFSRKCLFADTVDDSPA